MNATIRHFAIAALLTLSTVAVAESAHASETAVDYRAPGVSYGQFGAAAQHMVDYVLGQDLSDGTHHGQYVFARGFAWAAYERVYNRANYELWLSKLVDARLRHAIRTQVEFYVSGSRPPVGNPQRAEQHAVATWNALLLSDIELASR